MICQPYMHHIIYTFNVQANYSRTHMYCLQIKLNSQQNSCPSFWTKPRDFQFH